MSNNNDGYDTRITLDLSLAEVNLILDALGERPFVQVFSLIQSIQTQASNQLNAVRADESKPEEPHDEQA